MSNPKFPLLVSGSALGVGIALLAGCGGGGGGSSGGPSATPTPTPPPVSGQLFFDDFSANSLNTGAWGLYDSSQVLQRTHFGFTPTLLKEGSTSFARLRLDSYNPNFPGQFKGTEMFTRQRFSRGQGLEIQARLRAPGLPPGIVFAFFGIYDRYNGVPSDATYLKDEIDFEFLTAEQEQLGDRDRLYLNIWNDWNVRNGYDGDDIGTTFSTFTDKTYQKATDPNFDWANWNTYTIRWYPDRTEYYLNGVIQRTEREVKPDDDLSIHFNMWTGTPDFNQAYSASLQPANSPANNKTYVFDVDSLTVRRLGSALVAARTATSTGQYQPLPAGAKAYRNR